MTDDLPTPSVQKSSRWKLPVCLAFFTLVLIAGGLTTIYYGIKFGLIGGFGLDGESVTSRDDGISVTPRPADINPSEPYKTDFTQLENNSIIDSNENVTYLTDKIPAASSTELSQPQCIPRNTTICNNHLNYAYTFYPNSAGYTSEYDFSASRALLQTVIDSLCHPRIEEFICLATQPECRPDGKSIGPCRKFCHEIVNACGHYFWSVYEKERKMLYCTELYIDSTDQNLCYSPDAHHVTQYVSFKPLD